MMDSNALHLLRDGEICEVLIFGKWMEAAWSRAEQQFHYLTKDGLAVIEISEIEEWRPASAQF